MEIPSPAELDTKISELERQLNKVVEDKNFTATATVQEIIDTLKEERKDVLTSNEIDDLIDAKESELLALIATANFTNCQKIHAEIETWKAKQTRQMPSTDKGQEDTYRSKGQEDTYRR